MLPAIYISPPMPAPPLTTRAPVVVLVLATPELATKLPATTSTPPTVSELTNVVVPVTVKLPVTFMSPVAVILPVVKFA